MKEPIYRPGTKFVLALPKGEEIYVLDSEHFVSADRVFDLKVIDQRSKDKLEPVIRKSNAI